MAPVREMAAAARLLSTRLDHHAEALPARGRPRPGWRFLAVITERHHQIDRRDSTLHDVFRAQAFWEGVEDLL
jgi:hypothetical protein